MKHLSLLLLVFLFSFSTVNAAIQITTFGAPYGIVADTNEWTCLVDIKPPKLLQSTNCIKGTFKDLPLKFEFDTSSQFHGYHTYPVPFSTPHLKTILDKDSEVLKKYAILTKTVFSNVYIKESDKYYTIKGNFFDNYSSGYFALHILRPLHYSGGSYSMFVTLKTDLFDETTRDAIMVKPLELITPLFSPRNLSAILGIDFDSYSDCIILEE